MENHTLYNRPDVVKLFGGESHLQPPEEAILHYIMPDLGNWSLLDIGIGGGRTTLHFAGRCQKYTGIDINENMVECCKQRFANWPQPIELALGDARDLKGIDDNSVDFVLFSYNSIDYIEHADRMKAFYEIFRVLKPGGLFVFSSHNSGCIQKHFSLRSHLSRNPINCLRGLIHWLKLRFIHNSGKTIKQAAKAPRAMINDGAYDFGLQTYYVTVNEQIRQLDGLFDVDKIFSLETGEAYTDNDAAAASTDSWLYYLCRKA